MFSFPDKSVEACLLTLPVMTTELMGESMDTQGSGKPKSLYYEPPDLVSFNHSIQNHYNYVPYGQSAKILI